MTDRSHELDPREDQDAEPASTPDGARGEKTAPEEEVDPDAGPSSAPRD